MIIELLHSLTKFGSISVELYVINCISIYIHYPPMSNSSILIHPLQTKVSLAEALLEEILIVFSIKALLEKTFFASLVSVKKGRGQLRKYRNQSIL